mmetsp:Transcript_5266/g.18370  ORF Transcript_5266/g.18370 Transcript_5266/m.18370 type:complete len:285 (-) Transcript_5266:65-919(-)
MKGHVDERRKRPRRVLLVEAAHFGHGWVGRLAHREVEHGVVPRELERVEAPVDEEPERVGEPPRPVRRQRRQRKLEPTDARERGGRCGNPEQPRERGVVRVRVPSHRPHHHWRRDVDEERRHLSDVMEHERILLNHDAPSERPGRDGKLREKSSLCGDEVRNRRRDPPKRGGDAHQRIHIIHQTHHPAKVESVEPFMALLFVLHRNRIPREALARLPKPIVRRKAAEDEGGEANVEQPEGIRRRTETTLLVPRSGCFYRLQRLLKPSYLCAFSGLSRSWCSCNA